MLGEIFKAFLITSLAGSALTALITLLKPLTKRVFGYSWNYYIWLAALIVMILPVRFTLPQSGAGIPVINMRTEQTNQITTQADIADADRNVNTVNTITAVHKATDFINMIVANRMNYLAVIWLLGIAVLLIINIGGYIRLTAKIHRNSVVISCPEVKNYTGRKITVRTGKELSSPFMLGLFRPTLVLPDTELDETQLNNILRHETTHFKRKDILYKWFAVIVKCIHWFNPMIYYAVRQINTECEISCDLSVVSGMNDSERISYVNTILSLVSGGRVKRQKLTTQMASGKKALKRRFTMIKNVKKTSKFMSALSAIIAVVMFGTTVFASGVLSDIATDDYTIEIINNGEKIELTNNPFVENGEAYLPLREVFKKTGVMDNENSYIQWNNGKIEICVAYSESAYVTNTLPNEKSEPEMISILHNYRIEIGKNTLIINSAPSLLGTDVSFEEKMANAPMLRGSVTYVPFSYIVNMLNVEGWGINCCIYDKDGALADISVDKPEDYADIISWEPEPEIFADPYSNFLMTNYNQAMKENNLHGTYDYEYVRRRYNDANDKVDFYYQIKPFGEEDVRTLIMKFEKKGDDWVMYDSELLDGTI